MTVRLRAQRTHAGRPRKRKCTHCSRLKCLFSTPAWFTRMRRTAHTRSSAVRKRADVGESGKKNQNRTDVASVMSPVTIISLRVQREVKVSAVNGVRERAARERRTIARA